MILKTPKTLKAAALSGDIDATRYFLESNANPSQKVSCGTLLQSVIRHGFIDIAILLMEFGAEINTQDKWGNTPLHEAVNKESLLLVKKLLSRNANLFLKNNLGETPGSLAAKSGYLTIAQLLHPYFQFISKNQSVTFFKSNQGLIKNTEEIIIEVDPSLLIP